MANGIQFAWKQDEYYTPPLLVEPLLQYIPPGSTIWCPFDTADSEYVRIFEKSFTVVRGHINEGKDFFEYEPDNWDIIISNPPFSRKLEVLERCYSLGKPFALLLGLPILNYQEVGSFFLNRPLQLLIFDKKVSFDGGTSAFNSSYFCWNFLPKDLSFHHLPHNNSGKHFVGAHLNNAKKLNNK
jgi:hypothetical protein